MVYDPFSPEAKRDPYPFYAALRRDAPVFEIAGRGMWAVSRHADVGFALKRPDLFSSSVNADRVDLPASETLLGSDPPAHTGLRKRVEAAFSPRRIRALGARARSLAERLVSDLAARGGGDAVAALAAPLPLILIAELMGIDPAHHETFKRGAGAIIARGTGRPPASEDERAARDALVATFKGELAAVIEARRARPGDDLVSALVRAEDGAPGLSSAQALNFAVLLLIGGSETTTNLIGNALRALFADAETMARVRAERARVPALVEETLRFEAPVQSLLRRTTADVELAGTRIPAGEIALLLLGSASSAGRDLSSR